MDIDLNVNSESVFSGVFFLETIAMALEALGNVLASDIGICATLLKEALKPVQHRRRVSSRLKHAVRHFV
jgi:hypothetical protein